MLKYKTMMIITIASIAVVVAIDLANAAHLIEGFIVRKCLDVSSSILQIVSVYTLIVVLKYHQEKFWIIFPFYLTLVYRIAAFLLDQVPVSSRPGTGIYMFFGLLTLFSMVFMVISCFRVKHQEIKLYFRVYSLTFIVVIVLFMASTWLLALSLGLDSYLYQRYVRDFLLMTPIYYTLFIHLKLYTKYELFRLGDQVKLNKNLENIPAGSIGAIVKKHSDSNYYDIEFVNEHGDLLNIILLSADDMAHTEVPTLETRIDHFGEM